MNQTTKAALGMLEYGRALLAVVVTGPCGATDGLGLDPDDPAPFGICNLPAGHDTGGWHQQWREGELLAEWRGPAPGERCGICGKDGAGH